MKQSAILVFFLIALTAHAQQAPNVKYGKIDAADLQKKVYALDSSAAAVVIYEAGSTEVEGNSKGWFSLVYKVYTRIHILKKSGYDEADVEIPLYTSGDAE